MTSGPALLRNESDLATKLNSRVLSEFQAPTELDQIALDSLFVFKLRNETRAKVEMTLPDLGGVSDDRSEAEGVPAKTRDRTA